MDAAGGDQPARLVRPGYAVHEHTGDRSSRNRRLALADRDARIHECARVRRVPDPLPGRPPLVCVSYTLSESFVMPSWLQHLLVLLLVIGCCAFVARQALASLAGRKSKLGSCCAKGCSAGETAKPAAAASAAPKPERIVFMPIEMLSRRRH